MSEVYSTRECPWCGYVGVTDKNLKIECEGCKKIYNTIQDNKK